MYQQRKLFALLIFGFFIFGNLAVLQTDKKISITSGTSNLPPLEDNEKAFIEDVLKNLTLKGKIGQMTQLDITMLQQTEIKDEFVLSKEKLLKAVEYGVGSFLNTPFSGGPIGNLVGFNASQWIDVITAIQQVVMSSTPASISKSPIPMVYGLDSVHGANYVRGAAMFPHNTGLAATFAPELAKKAGRVSSKDTKASGIPWSFTPVLGVGVQPLWPRIYETFGEDPYLASVMGEHAILGLQDDNKLSSDLATAACMKHFLGYPAPKSGKDRTQAWIPERFIRRYFVPPFQTAVDAGVASVMINSGEISGIPVHSSHEYLTDLLRTELGFEGLAVTDWQDIEKLVTDHHVAATQREAVKMSVLAGIDMSMVPKDFTFSDLLLDLVKSGEISEARIDQSVRRIIEFKYRLGLFSSPFPNKANPYIKSIGSPQDRELSKNIVRESITLLQNNKNLLPLSIGTTKKILVTGPAGNSLTNQNGGWSLFWGGGQSDKYFPYGTTIFQGIQSIVGNSVKVEYVQGADFDQVTDIDNAVKEAETSDVIILCVGEAPESETGGNINDLTISQPQQTLATKLFETGKPIVTILVEARPRILNSILNQTTALIMAYLPSSEAGEPIAEILFGKVNPSGKLPLTYPQFTGDVGVQYYRKYSDVTTPAFTFGDGLSYTTFAYSNLNVQVHNMSKSHIRVSVSVDVTNTGRMAGKEAVLLYVGDLYASITPEVKMLRRFKKEFIEPGNKTTFKFELVREDFTFIGRDNKPTIEAGEFIISTGNLQKSFTLSF